MTNPYDAAKGAYDDAVRTLQLEPEALTENQITVLKSAEVTLGNLAISRRDDALHKAAEARHRKALGQPEPSASKYDEIADGVINTIVLALVEPRQLIKRLEGRCQALDARVLELEAETAAARPPAVDHAGR